MLTCEDPKSHPQHLQTIETLHGNPTVSFLRRPPQIYCWVPATGLQVSWVSLVAPWTWAIQSQMALRGKTGPAKLSGHDMVDTMILLRPHFYSSSGKKLLQNAQIRCKRPKDRLDLQAGLKTASTVEHVPAAAGPKHFWPWNESNYDFIPMQNGGPSWISGNLAKVLLTMNMGSITFRTIWDII